MEIPVLKGRQIEQSDSEHSPGVVVINQAMARQYFRNENPIGKRIVIAQNLGPDFADEPREIVGVVGDAKADEINDSAPPSMYTPFSQISPHLASLLVGTIPIRWAVRTKSDSDSLAKELATAMLQVDPEQPIAEVRMMRELLSDALGRWRFNMLLLAPSPVSRFSWPLLASTESSPIRSPNGHVRSESGWRLGRAAHRSSGWCSRKVEFYWAAVRFSGFVASPS